MRLPLFLALALLAPLTAKADIIGPARVIDGATIEVVDERIRLHGIELAQTYEEDRRVVPTLPMVDLAGPARVIDGDTLEVVGMRIRIHGIDAPEMDQTCSLPNETIACGALARAALVDLLDGVDVSCEELDRDRYGRIVAVCHAGGIDIGENMVHAGWALAYRRYSTEYVGAEVSAKEARRGMWRGEFVAPWDWRRGERLELSAEEEPRVCCKVCRKGKACGNSCIARSKTCHKAPGCACDAD